MVTQTAAEWVHSPRIERQAIKAAYGLTAGLVAGLGLGLFFGLNFGPAVGLVFGLVFGPVVGLGSGLAHGLIARLFGHRLRPSHTSLRVGLYDGLVVGMFVAWCGTVVALVVGQSIRAAVGRDVLVAVAFSGPAVGLIFGLIVGPGLVVAGWAGRGLVAWARRRV